MTARAHAQNVDLNIRVCYNYSEKNFEPARAKEV